MVLEKNQKQFPKILAFPVPSRLGSLMDLLGQDFIQTSDSFTLHLLTEFLAQHVEKKDGLTFAVLC